MIVTPDANIFISKIELEMGCTNPQYFGDIGLRGKIPWFFKDYCCRPRAHVVVLPSTESTITYRLRLAQERVLRGQHRLRLSKRKEMENIINFLRNDPKDLYIEEMLVKAAILHYLTYHREKGFSRKDFDRERFDDILFEVSQQATKILYGRIILPSDIELLDIRKIGTYDTPEIQKFSKFILQECKIPYEKSKNGVEREDRDALIEAFKVYSMRNQTICFLTEDKGMRNYKEMIEKNSGNNVEILDANSFYRKYRNE